ncbi:hypothetical protein EYZ11_012012 [Aspergillus tanneri]|uniref:Uncharacterized protein n=1 Tax=Aspergillus tanneri TaxID=1220188 RepID=A0A4S3J6P3_9EURO|nr:hypothetical protein EYZ11_012012 [Aspergillus tanneri]
MSILYGKGGQARLEGWPASHNFSHSCRSSCEAERVAKSFSASTAGPSCRAQTSNSRTNAPFRIGELNAVMTILLVFAVVIGA